MLLHHAQANYEIDWGCIPKGVGLSCLILSVPIFGGIGSIIMDKVNARYQFSSKVKVNQKLYHGSPFSKWRQQSRFEMRFAPKHQRRLVQKHVSNPE